MDGATAARIQDWDERPVSEGYRGLDELADANFTGAVTTGSAWLFMLNGRIVSAVDGTVSAFEQGQAKAYSAPDPGLPLLYAMQAEGGEPRAKYYTDDNPLPEVHETLVDAEFTGYLELSENVLSGDYYVVYYGGKSMSVAFVGNSRQLVTGDEAFREAADEVGIYEVIDVELNVRSVPEPSPVDTGNQAAAAGAQEATAPTESVEDTDDDSPEEPAQSDESEAGGTESAEASSGDASTPEPQTATATETADRPSGEHAASETSVPEGDGEDPFSEEEAWRETRSIPALDPEESEAVRESATNGPTAPEPEPTDEPTQEPESTPEPEPPESVDERIAELEAAIESQSETIAQLEAELDSSNEEIQQLRQERDALESELATAKSETGASESTTARESLGRERALDQTDLFVRYDSQGGGTLEKAHDGQVDRDGVVNNLRIDHHTRFDADGIAVEGQPFDRFLEESLEYQFVDWLVTEFLFEIQDTGSQRGLRDVFDAIPLIDRAEFHGEVTWRDQEEGETVTESFDVVCRDRMGQALIVANLNDVRDPATAEMMETLIGNTSTTAEGTETLGGAFLVTSSFFRPDALEAASEATGGGLLSREKRWSYVKLSRNRGYHLCLVEAREDDFHVAVPEL
ncbi:MAG: hypothetical protein ABEH59_01705 [Halobacteriales archaeon]